MTTESESQPRRLLATMTGEPFQPARIHYVIRNKPLVLRKLKKLECTVELPAEHCWLWLYQAEAASLRFSAGGYDDIPDDRHPVVLGRIRFPTRNSMTLEANSVDRAIVGARFFSPRLGADVVATRCRLVNRCFAGEEGQPGELMATLDRDVTVVDPREAEAALRDEFGGGRSSRDAERAVTAFLERRIKSKEADVPMVEDFPLAPEEETPEFQHLANTLQLRCIRAIEHWRGNTHLTLAAIITRHIGQALSDVPEK